ncbi:MAG TPA: hypothetical protein VNT55_22970 [Baekduia sp.]|nr:hypothetical protein [Baekduia sp.]
MSALHVFDMDGTLLRDTSAGHEISRRMGTMDELAELEARWAAHEITEPQFAAGIRAMWGELTHDVVAAVVADAPWIAGIDRVCAGIAARGETSMLITMSPDFVAQHVLTFGVAHVRASAFPDLPFARDIDPAGILTPADKVRLVDEPRLTHLSRCVNLGAACPRPPTSIPRRGPTPSATRGCSGCWSPRCRSWPGAWWR